MAGARAAVPRCSRSAPAPATLPNASHSQVVYERTVAAFPVTHYLWLQYCRYLESSLKIPAGEWAALAMAALGWAGSAGTSDAAHAPPTCPLCTANCPAVINAAYSRALRNCPWVGMLWGRALRALERSGAPEDQHAALYDRALAAGLQVRAV